MLGHGPTHGHSCYTLSFSFAIRPRSKVAVYRATSIEFHRNGVGGDPFTVVSLSSPDGDLRAVVFSETLGDLYAGVAVIAADDPGAKYRGDRFAVGLRQMIARYDSLLGMEFSDAAKREALARLGHLTDDLEFVASTNEKGGENNMGERIEGGVMPPPQTGRKRRRRGKYPWDEWFDGSVWRLTRGQDFQVSLAAFRGAAGSAAKRQGVRITTRKVGDNTILLQAVGGVEDQPAPDQPRANDTERKSGGGFFSLWRRR